MTTITDQQIDFILGDLKGKGITTESLLNNLVDHICSIIEANLPADGDFEQYYNAILPSFYKQDIAELERATRLLVKVRRPFALLSRLQFIALLFGCAIAPCLIGIILGSTVTGTAGGRSLGTVMVWLTLYALLIVLVIWTTPDELDPLIPRRSKILLAAHPFVTILPTR